MGVQLTGRKRSASFWEHMRHQAGPCPDQRIFLIAGLQRKVSPLGETRCNAPVGMHNEET
jgi:hypothetical protein